MPAYADAEQFYTIMDEGFQRMAADPQALTDFQRRRMAVLLRTAAPETATLIDGRVDPVQISFGAAAGKADLALMMPGDLLHEILMERASIKSSFMSGNIQVSGNVFRAMQLADLFHQIQRVYPQVRRDLGFDGVATQAAGQTLVE